MVVKLSVDFMRECATQVIKVQPALVLLCTPSDYTLGKDMNPFITPAFGYIVSLLFFYKDSFGIK